MEDQISLSEQETVATVAIEVLENERLVHLLILKERLL